MFEKKVGIFFWQILRSILQNKFLTCAHSDSQTNFLFSRFLEIVLNFRELPTFDRRRKQMMTRVKRVQTRLTNYSLTDVDIWYSPLIMEYPRYPRSWKFLVHIEPQRADNGVIKYFDSRAMHIACTLYLCSKVYYHIQSAHTHREWQLFSKNSDDFGISLKVFKIFRKSSRTKFDKMKRNIPRFQQCDTVNPS